MPESRSCLTKNRKGIISPNLYGQFTEHIGGVIYDGDGVGENSSSQPIRNSICAHRCVEEDSGTRYTLWPGGCFADSYDWMDGVGPAASRPGEPAPEGRSDAARLHERGDQVFESNRFRTNEFMRFCSLIGAQPYVAANVRSLPPLSFDRWVEYYSGRKHGIGQDAGDCRFRDPFRVRYWGVEMKAGAAVAISRLKNTSSEFRRFTNWVPRYGVDLQFIGSGPNNNDLDWTSYSRKSTPIIHLRIQASQDGRFTITHRI